MSSIDNLVPLTPSEPSDCSMVSSKLGTKPTFKLGTMRASMWTNGTELEVTTSSESELRTVNDMATALAAVRLRPLPTSAGNPLDSTVTQCVSCGPRLNFVPASSLRLLSVLIESVPLNGFARWFPATTLNDNGRLTVPGVQTKGAGVMRFNSTAGATSNWLSVMTAKA